MRLCATPCPALLASPSFISARGLISSAAASRHGSLHRRPGRSERCLVVSRAASSSSKSKQLYICGGCGEQSAQW